MAYTTIDDPSAHFKVQLYTGTGSSHAVTFDDTDTDMQPDLVWVATRNENEIQPIMNSVSGTGKYLRTNANDSEESAAESIKAFGSDGFTMGTENRVNQSSNTFVAWCWKAGGPAASVASNTAGSINTTKTSANTTSGFSISTFTGTGANATIGHGIGIAPEWVIIKKTNGVQSWPVFHKYGLDETDKLYLNTTAATADSAAYWQDTLPSTTLITLGSDGDVNDSSGALLALAWSPVQGFSKFGKYTGDGLADGPFVHTGFRPAFVLVKKASATDNWFLFDNKREGYNAINDALRPNLANSELNLSGVGMDLLSNGFKLRSGDDDLNDSNTFIYMAFAEAPEVNSNGVPCNAR